VGATLRLLSAHDAPISYGSLEPWLGVRDAPERAMATPLAIEAHRACRIAFQFEMSARTLVRGTPHRLLSEQTGDPSRFVEPKSIAIRPA